MSPQTNRDPSPAQRVLPETPAVFQSVSAALRDRLRAGEWRAGDRLPSISQLAVEYGVGTGSIREALRSLQTMGLVRIEHGRGVFVVNLPAGADLALHFESGGTGLLVALAEARRIIEPELVALAAERATDQELDEINTLAHTMEEQAAHGLDFVDPDMGFHRRIAQAARNPVLAQMMDGIHDLFLVSRVMTARDPGMTARAVRYHILIAEALRGRNANQARLLMHAHTEDTVTTLTAMRADEMHLHDSGR